ncbi:hypothetical protein GCM10009539_42590 [Cryptosporangium japonicum]|uniref:CdiI immunity protein domain-containing protein n=2 Tax=Cryptosporangium japonicum TaxID=80872 RepID=A0ABN0UJS5_9ACTN
MQAPSIPGTHDRTVPSLRLRQILRTYCWNFDPSGIADLRASLDDGHYTWLRDELARAMAGCSEVSGWWRESVGEFGGSAAAAQRDLWRRLFPGQPEPDPAIVDAASDAG